MPISGVNRPMSAANGISSFSRGSAPLPTPPPVSKYDPAPNYDPMRRPTVSTPISTGPKLQAVNPIKPYSYSEPNIAPYSRVPVKQPAGFSLAPGSPSLTLPPSSNPTNAPAIGAVPKVNLPEIANSAKNLGSSLPSGAVAGLARGLVGAILAKGINDDLKYESSDAAGAERKKRLEDAVKNGPLNLDKIPPWLNPLNWGRKSPSPGEDSATEGQVLYPGGQFYRFFAATASESLFADGQIEGPITSIGYRKYDNDEWYAYAKNAAGREIGLRLYGYPESRPVIQIYKGIQLQPSPPPPTVPDPPTYPAPVIVDGVPISPFAATPSSSAPTALPTPQPVLSPPTLPKDPEKYPALDPKKSDLPLPKTNRPTDPNTTPAPLIPAIPFIPLPAKAPQGLNQNTGFQSLTNPSTSPVVNPGTGAGGNLTPPPPPIAPARPRCRDGCAARLEDKIDGLGQKMNGGIVPLTPGGQPADLGLLQVINEKLGGQLLGGISGKLNRIAITLQFDRILQALNLITVLHNASMLSGSLASTLGSVTSQALSVIGIKDENGSPLDINGILSKEADELMKSVLGNEVWTGTKENWNKANRIISTASQIVWTIRSMADAARDVMEWTAENTGKIGNALKRFRVVGEHAYSWMPERVNMQNRWTKKVNQFTENISNIDNTASSLSSVVGSVQSIEDEFGQIKEQRENFDKALKEALPKTRVDNDATKQKATLTTAASASPVLQPSDRDKGEPTP